MVEPDIEGGFPVQVVGPPADLFAAAAEDHRRPAFPQDRPGQAFPERKAGFVDEVEVGAVGRGPDQVEFLSPEEDLGPIVDDPAGGRRREGRQPGDAQVGQDRSEPAVPRAEGVSPELDAVGFVDHGMAEGMPLQFVPDPGLVQGLGVGQQKFHPPRGQPVPDLPALVPGLAALEDGRAQAGPVAAPFLVGRQGPQRVDDQGRAGQQGRRKLETQALSGSGLQDHGLPDPVLGQQSGDDPFLVGIEGRDSPGLEGCGDAWIHTVPDGGCGGFASNRPDVAGRVESAGAVL